MVNFRFHLVSLTAVFLALAAGITIGAGVVQTATVDQIEGQLQSIKDNREETNAENDLLRADLSRWGEISQQAGDRLLERRLDGTNVFVIGVDGVDRKVMEGFRNSLAVAGANVGGVLWFTGKWSLKEADDQRQLAALLDAPPTTKPEDLRVAALSTVATAWNSGDGGIFVTDLRDAAFLEFEASPGGLGGLAELPAPESLFVILSGDGARVPSADLAVPLVGQLSSFGLRILAVQPIRPPKPKQESAGESDEPPPEFVVALRDDDAMEQRVSTVDNIDDYRGRVAAVFALQDLRSTRIGHYGFGEGARIVPEPL